MFVSSIIDFETFSKFYLDVSISFIDKPCFHSVTRFYISENIAKITISGFGCSRIGSHK